MNLCLPWAFLNSGLCCAAVFLTVGARSWGLCFSRVGGGAEESPTFGNSAKWPGIARTCVRVQHILWKRSNGSKNWEREGPTWRVALSQAGQAPPMHGCCIRRTLPEQTDSPRHS